MDERPTHDTDADEFEAHADGKHPGLLREMFDLLRDNRKWWMVPIIVLLVLIGLLLILSSSALAPFLYPLF